jgi:hypothetical protein
MAKFVKINKYAEKLISTLNASSSSVDKYLATLTEAN